MAFLALTISISCENETDNLMELESKRKVLQLEETREEIVKYLRPKDIKNLSLVSTEWRKFLDKPKYWRRFKVFLTKDNYSEVLTSERLVVRNKVALWYKTKTADDGEQVMLKKVKEMIDQQETKLSKLTLVLDLATANNISSAKIQLIQSIEQICIKCQPSWQQIPNMDILTYKIARRSCNRYCVFFFSQLFKEIKRSGGRLKELCLDMNSSSWMQSENWLWNPEVFAAAITKLTVFKYFGRNIKTDHLKALFEKINKDPDQINLRRVYLGISPSVWIKRSKELHGECLEARKHVQFLFKKKQA